MSRTTGIAASATLIGLLTAVSLALGLVRDVAIASVFGATAEVDAYFVAQGLMNLALGLIAGALAKAVVPVVAPAVAEGRPGPAHRSVATALAIALVVLGTGSIVVALLAREAVAIVAPGFDAATSALSAELTRVVLVATVLIAATNVLAAVAQSHGRFFWASAQGIPFNVVMIVSASVFGPTHGVIALAGGFVVGSAARLALQLIPLRELRVRLIPTLDLADPRLRTIGRLVPPLLVGSAVHNVNTLVDQFVASLQGAGTVAALGYGWRIVSIGEMLVVASLVTALYPAIGATAEPAGRAEMRRLVARGLTVATFILAPVVAVLVVAATPVVALLFGRGSFGPEDVSRTATALVWLAPGLLPLAWGEVIVRASYALRDSRTPVAVALAAMAVNVVGDLTLGMAFGIPGIAATSVFSLAVAALANGALLSRRYAALDGVAVSASLCRLGLAGLVSAGVAAVTLALVEGAAGSASDSASLGTLVRVVAVAVAVAATFAAVLRLTGIPESALLRESLRAVAAWFPGRLRLGPRR